MPSQWLIVIIIFNFYICWIFTNKFNIFKADKWKCKVKTKNARSENWKKMQRKMEKFGKWVEKNQTLECEWKDWKMKEKIWKWQNELGITLSQQVYKVKELDDDRQWAGDEDWWASDWSLMTTTDSSEKREFVDVESSSQSKKSGRAGRQ